MQDYLDKKMDLRMSTEMKEMLLKYSEEHEMKMSDVVRMALKEFFSK